jgi:transposase
LCAIEPEIAQASRLAREFLGLVHRRDVDGFDRWLARARDSKAPEIRRFAVSLAAYLPAVRAAFESSWSSGQVEGQIDRLQFLSELRTTVVTRSAHDPHLPSSTAGGAR